MRIGETILLDRPAYLQSAGAIVGQKEKEGPLGPYFAHVALNERFGTATFEQAESKMQAAALRLALDKIGRSSDEVDLILAGDLLNQCVASAYGMRAAGRPFLGLYGACSTMAESALLASLLVSTGVTDLTAAVTSSHFSGAERQFRQPLEYGGQRPPSAQWTVTAAGCLLFGKTPAPLRVSAVRAGRIVDAGVRDMTNMGACMAPAAAATLAGFFRDTQTAPSDYSRIATGDLGFIGADLLTELLAREGYRLGEEYRDCGKMIFDREVQDVHSGGSGCGCSAAVLSCVLLPELAKTPKGKLLFCATGALMSTLTSQQGESVPGICHLVCFERGE